MSDRDALLAAIRANPDDDTTRLVFADWLDDHADAFPTPAAMRQWAAFIRDDITMSQREEFDPLRLRWEWIEKPRREAESWAKQSLPPELRVAPPEGERLFRRGFPWFVPLKPKQLLNSAERLFADMPSVTVAYRKVDTSAAHWFRSPHFARVSGLRIEAVTLPVEAVQALVESPHAAALQELRTGTNSLTLGGFRMLLRSELFPRLTRLAFEGRMVFTLELMREIQAVTTPTRLCELSVAESGISHYHIGPVLAAPAARGLAKLSLAGCSLWGSGYEMIVRLDLPQLRELDLSETSPGSTGFRAFSTSGVLSRLTRLGYRNNHVNSTLMGELAACHEASNLRVLNLASNAIGNDGAAALARSPHFAGLRVLNLSHCMIGDEGMEAILESPLAENLVLLDLRGSPASEEMKEVVKAKMNDRVRL